MFRRYIGIDLSIRSTGIVILNGEHKQWAVIKPEDIKGQHDMDKFNFLAQEVFNFCRLTTMDLIVIEDYAFSAKGQITRIAEMGGIVKHVLYTQSGVPVNRFVRASPTTLKKFTLGKGTGKKNQMLLGVYKKWGFDAPNDDINDAYVAARLGMAIAAPQEELLKYEAECVAATLKKNKMKFSDVLIY